MALIGFATTEDLKQIEYSLDQRTRELRRVEERLAAAERTILELGGGPSLAKKIAQRTGLPTETVDAVLKALDEVDHGNPGSH